MNTPSPSVYKRASKKIRVGMMSYSLPCSIKMLIWHSLMNKPTSLHPLKPRLNAAKDLHLTCQHGEPGDLQLLLALTVQIFLKTLAVESNKCSRSRVESNTCVTCTVALRLPIFSFLSHATAMSFLLISISTPVDPCRNSFQPSGFLHPLCHATVAEHTAFQLSSHLLCTPRTMELVP